MHLLPQESHRSTPVLHSQTFIACAQSKWHHSWTRVILLVSCLGFDHKETNEPHSNLNRSHQLWQETRDIQFSFNNMWVTSKKYESKISSSLHFWMQKMLESCSWLLPLSSGRLHLCISGKLIPGYTVQHHKTQYLHIRNREDLKSHLA
jgi:hypothetical protein